MSASFGQESCECLCDFPQQAGVGLEQVLVEVFAADGTGAQPELASRTSTLIDGARKPPSIVGSELVARPGSDFAVDGRGDAVAVWDSWTEGFLSHRVVQAAFRLAGGEWQALVDLSEENPLEEPYEPRVAIDEHGDAVVVWSSGYGESGGVMSAFKPGGDAWQVPVELSPPARPVDIHRSPLMGMVMRSPCGAIASPFSLRSSRLVEIGSYLPISPVKEAETRMTPRRSSSMGSAGLAIRPKCLVAYLRIALRRAKILFTLARDRSLAKVEGSNPFIRFIENSGPGPDFQLPMCCDWLSWQVAAAVASAQQPQQLQLA